MKDGMCRTCGIHEGVKQCIEERPLWETGICRRITVNWILEKQVVKMN
jgi:hypothetical protein